MLQKLIFKPGVNRDQTNYANEGGWYACDKIRFRSGFPQKIGGWVKYTSSMMYGICRQMWNWVTSYGDNLLALGTNQKVYIEVAGYLNDITPLRETFGPPVTNNCFRLTAGSTTVLVTIVAHGANTGDFVTFSGVSGTTADPNNLAGVPVTYFNQNFRVSVITNDTFTITIPVPAGRSYGWGAGPWGASSWGNSEGYPVTVGGGTEIYAAFEINSGYAINTYEYGWGTSSFGTPFGWGDPSVTPVIQQQRDWWFDNFDNDLVMNIRNGAIYYWERGTSQNIQNALATRAFPLSELPDATDVPAVAMQVLVSPNDKHLIAFGCTPYGGGQADPLLIRWSNQDDPGNWTPEVTNSAGFIRIGTGSKITRAIRTRQEILVFTEGNLYSLQFLGTTDVFGIQEYADNISLIGPRGVISANNTTYWMGHDKFYAYGGRVETLPCTLRNHVFDDINYAQTDQVISGTNEGWNEVWWYYPSKNSDVVDKYVIYNHLEKIWYYGNLERTAWLDSPLREYPQAVASDLATETGYLYDHERGVNNDELAMDSYIQSSDVDINDGEEFTLIKRIIPDLNFGGSTAAEPVVKMTVKPRNFPGSLYQVEPNESVVRTIEVPIEKYTDQVFIRARARQIGIKILSDSLGVQWQLGAPRIDGRPDGKR